MGVCWVLIGSRKAVSSRIHGYRIHEHLLAGGWRSGMLFAPAQWHTAFQALGNAALAALGAARAAAASAAHEAWSSVSLRRLRETLKSREAARALPKSHLQPPMNTDGPLPGLSVFIGVHLRPCFVLRLSTCGGTVPPLLLRHLQQHRPRHRLHLGIVILVRPRREPPRPDRILRPQVVMQGHRRPRRQRIEIQDRLRGRLVELLQPAALLPLGLLLVSLQVLAE